MLEEQTLASVADDATAPGRSAVTEEHAPEGTPDTTTTFANGTYPSCYAGAMLLWLFLERLGIDAVLAGMPIGTQRR